MELVDNQITMEIPDPIAENLKKCSGFKLTEIKPEVPKPVAAVQHKGRGRSKKATKKD